MCGLFGFSKYNKDEIKNLSVLTNSLAEQSAVRGTDATGIAFTGSGGINVIKDSKSAYRMDFKHADNISALIGHTRHSTQGSEKRNINNHPFCSKHGASRFALAHNGVLTNDKELRRKLKLPKTKIETDSYIAVQLIESQKHLNFDSIRYMAEKTEGSFSYSILDEKNNIYLVKGDSPLTVLHFPLLKMYVYASTDEILYKALIDVPLLFGALKNGEFEEISISEGEILKIKPDGATERDNFEYSYYSGRGWWNYGFVSSERISMSRNDYVSDLKSVASYYGYSPDFVDELITAGISLDEIEEYMYCGCEI